MKNAQHPHGRHEISFQALVCAALTLLVWGAWPGLAQGADTKPPSVPTGLSASNIRDTMITMFWNGAFDNDSGVAGYKIYREDIQVGSATDTVYHDYNLTPQTSYRYAVAAYDNAGNVSNKSAAVTLVTKPSTPTGLQATTLSSSSIRLTWNTPPDADRITSYKIYSNDLLATGNNVAGTSATRSGLNPGTAYWYKVSSLNGAGTESIISASVTATTSPDTNAPDISFSAPASDAAVSGIVPLTVSASDSGGVSYVKFYIDNTLISTDTASPYQADLDTTIVANGLHTLKATAADNAGNTVNTTITITVTNAAQAPQITFRSPSANATVTGIVTIDFTINTSGRMQSAILKVDGTVIANSTGGGMLTSWNSKSVPNGDHTITVVATDTEQNTATKNIAVKVQNDAAADPPGNNPTALPGAHPDGTLVLDGRTVYLIKNGQLYGFRDANEYSSHGYDFGQVVAISAADKNLPAAADIMKALEGSLVLDKSDGRTVYMIGLNGTKRGFVSEEVFKGLGYKFDGLLSIDLSDYPAGDPIASAAEAHPDGALVLDGATVWWIRGDKRQGFQSAEVFHTYGFSFSNIVAVNGADMALLQGDPVKFRDGTLVLDGGDGQYYLISDGKKLKFRSSSHLLQMGYKISNVISARLDSYASGGNLE